ncbi:MAG: DUF4349 domain-containing protein [Acidimicrobiia bacterium]|nr:DUF4349 domain-containing protein [Acidimicrobiia bacterium]
MASTDTRSRERGRHRRGGVRLLVALAAATLLLLGACSTGGDDSDSAEMATDAGDGSGSDGGAPSDSDAGRASGGAEGTAGEESSETPTADQDEAGAGGIAPVVLTPADIGRSIVYTATVELQTDNVAAASREAQLRVSALGGLVFGQETTTDPQPRTVLVFKVTPESFGPALEALGGLGEVIRQDISADDVTERVVDLQSQIASTEVSVERLRQMLDQAPNLETVAALEGQLLQRETSLEQMRGQLRTLQDQVSLATITLTITQPQATPSMDIEVSTYVGDDDGARCPGDDELTVDEGDQMVLCLTIENSGNVSLTELEVRDHNLGLDPDDVTIVDFAADDELAPGDSITAWARFVAATDEQPHPDVSAVPVDELGTHLRIGVETPITPVELTVTADESLPGFGDSLASGFGALQWALAVAVVVLGLVIPLLVVIVPVGAIWWWRRERRNAEIDRLTDPPTPAEAI